ncbi:hypothetical protein D3C87_998430 [compost metagenome]
MQYTLPIDIAGNIAEYGGLVSLPKEEILARILTIDPRHNFKKDYLVRMYKQLALQSEYGKIIEYCYKHNIGLYLRDTLLFQNENIILLNNDINYINFSKMTHELENLLSFDGYSVVESTLQTIFNPYRLRELFFYWNMYNCIRLYNKNISFDFSNEKGSQIESVASRETHPEDQLYYCLEIIPLNNGFRLGSIVMANRANNGYYLNCIGIINSLGLRYVPEESYEIPDQLINPHGIEWYDLFERHELLEILNETNRLASFKRRNRGTLQEKLLQILSRYDFYTVYTYEPHNIRVTGFGEKNFDQLYEELSLAFNDGSIEPKVSIESIYSISINYPIFDEFYRLYVAYNDVNYNISNE